MDNAMVVNVSQGGADLHGDIEDFAPVHFAIVEQNVVEAFPFDVFHRVIVMSVLKPGLDKANDIRMIELAQAVDLELKAMQESDFLSQLARQDLDGGLPACKLLLGQENSPHA